MPLDATLAFASGVPLIAFGVFLVLMRPVSSPSLFFGLFATLWGLQVMAANAGRMLDSEEWLRIGLYLSFALLPAMTLYFGRFLALVGDPRWRAPVTYLVIGLCVVAESVLLFASDRVLVETGRTGDGSLFAELGGLAVPLFFVPFHGVLIAGLFLLFRRYQNAQLPLNRRRIMGMLVALALTVSYYAIYNVLFFWVGSDLVRTADSVTEWMLPVMFVISTGLVLAVALVVATDKQAPRIHKLLVLVALALPAVAAAAQFAAYRVTGAAEAVDTIGIWRLGTVGVLAYTLARHQLFDIDLRIKWTLKQGSVGAALAAVFFVAKEGLEQLLPVEGTIVGILAAVGATITFYPVQILMTRAADRVFPQHINDADFLESRKFEVYRTALETAYEDGEVTPREERLLEALRTQIGLAEQEASRLKSLVRARASVL